MVVRRGGAGGKVRGRRLRARGAVECLGLREAWNLMCLEGGVLGYLYWGGEGFTWGRGQGIRLGIGKNKRSRTRNNETKEKGARATLES